MEQQENSLSHPLKHVTAWDTAITDAEKRIQEAKGRIETLKRSIRTFKRLRDKGEPFPGEKSEQMEAGA